MVDPATGGVGAEAPALDRARAQEAIDDGVGRRLEVQIWLGQQGMPAASSEVFVLEQPAASTGAVGQADLAHLAELAELRGRRYRADVNGRVLLPPVADRLVLAARLPGLFGALAVGVDHADVETITLAPDQAVTVRVVDAGDAPLAGATVRLNQMLPAVVGMEWVFEELQALEREIAELNEQMRQSTSEEVRKARAPDLREMQLQYARIKRRSQGVQGGRGAARTRAEVAFAVVADELARRESDDQGLAVFRHIQLLRRENDASWPEERRDRFEVALAAPLAEPVTSAFSDRSLPDEVIVLRSPDSGRVTMRMVDHAGRPFAHPVHVQLYRDGDESDEACVQAMKPQGEVALVMPHVGLDLKLLAHFQLDDDAFHWSTAIRTPAQRGEHLELDVVVAPTAGMLFGEVQDAAGAPLGGATLDLAIHASEAQIEVERLQLDGEGRFHLPYARPPEMEGPFSLTVRRAVTPVEGGEFVLAALPAARVIDVGALKIGQVSVLAAGVVVDDLGVPIAGASVQLQRHKAADPGSAAMHFRDEFAARVETFEDGRFQMFGARDRSRSRLFVKAADHFPAETPDLVAGDEGLRVELLRKARLAGVVIVPAWIHPGYVRVDLLPQHVPSLPPGGAASRKGRIEGDQLAFDWLRAGTYTLTFAMKGFRRPFLRVEDLVVEPGQDGLHPELDGLDLSRFIHRFELYAVDENGDPVVVDRPMLARLTHEDGSRSWVGLAVRGGASEVFSATPQLEVFPSASGYVADPQVLAPGPNEVVYRRIPPVELELGGLSAMSQGLSVYVALEQLDRGALPASLGEGFDNISSRMASWYEKARFSAAELEEDDTARFVLPAGGPHKVSLRVSKGEGEPTFAELGTVQLDLLPGGPTVRVAVAYDAAAVQAVITAVRQQ